MLDLKVFDEQIARAHNAWYDGDREAEADAINWLGHQAMHLVDEIKRLRGEESSNRIPGGVFGSAGAKVSASSFREYKENPQESRGDQEKPMGVFKAAGVESLGSSFKEYRPEKQGGVFGSAGVPATGSSVYSYDPVTGKRR